MAIFFSVHTFTSFSIYPAENMKCCLTCSHSISFSVCGSASGSFVLPLHFAKLMGTLSMTIPPSSVTYLFATSTVLKCHAQLLLSVVYTLIIYVRYHIILENCHSLCD